MTLAEVEGTFYGERTGFVGLAENDVKGIVSLVEPEDYWVKLDYSSNSVGIVLAEVITVDKIELTPALQSIDNRVVQKSLSVYYSLDNFTWNRLPEESWDFEKDQNGKITILFLQSVEAQAIKVLLQFEDRNRYYEILDKFEFYGDLRSMVKVYQQVDIGRLEYEYDAVGNRLAKRTVVSEGEINYVTCYLGKVVFEENVSENKKASYVFAPNRQIAKITGIIGSGAETVYYH